MSRPIIFLDDGGVMNDPSDALVVDDSPHVLRRAAQAGARTILVHSTPPSETETTICINSLAELPEKLSASQQYYNL